eukprot:CAMPEP_0114137518 /NCGR_PEP_ID=MMETSP0043_2-20121206/15816_1 /TAXON_ID=464988 /ORGANISM="Hemiselmis andersenii, Strain CCMP644" /LENGTH=488 /DNA_ID=CAMNT_0001231395 /DNA_START=198 /DNA_END=1660 /DNA_ORIENTATION=-
MACKRIVLWFRNDLRLTDNYIVSEAARRASASPNLEVVPFYCFDSRHYTTSKTSFGFKKTGARRAKFVIEAVEDLRSRLRAVGSDLLVTCGKPEEEIVKLMNAGGTKVLTQEEVTSEELAVDNAVRAAIKASGGELETVWGYSMYHKDDLPFQASLADMPNVMTPFKDKCETHSQIRPPVPAPKSLPPVTTLAEKLGATVLPTLQQLGFSEEEAKQAQTADPRGVMSFVGGETAGLARVKEYIFDNDCLKDYFDTRNGMVGKDYSTKFSSWLAIGCVSPRYIAEQCREYERVRGIKNKSTYWVIWELTVRDFFRFQSAKHGNKVFFAGGPADVQRRWGTNKEAFGRWVSGNTGHPLVDANMRELALTGFMSNRGRQNVASFLVHNLGLDWRLGAAYFEEILLDHDVSANWGNWNAAAGVNGGRINRFNILKQSKDYDEEGVYVKRWCPELSKVPPSRVHEPWQMNSKEMEQYGVSVVPYTGKSTDEST